MKNTGLTGIARGYSMAPLINPGDRLFISGAKKQDIMIGDIVVFLEKKRVLSHRVIWKIKGSYILKGDNVKKIDKKLNIEDVLGRVIKIDGKYGIINFEKRIVKLLQYLFLYRSILLLYIPHFLHIPVSKILRGRKFTVKHFLVE